MAILQPKPSESSPIYYMNYTAMAELGIPGKEMQIHGEGVIGNEANSNEIEQATDNQH